MVAHTPDVAGQLVGSGAETYVKGDLLVPPRPRLLAIMGSGETAPTMARVRRVSSSVSALHPSMRCCSTAPTAFGKTLARSPFARWAIFGTFSSLDVASWPAAVDVLRRERAFVQVKDADYVFAGPGSRTYAHGVWEHSRLRNVLGNKLTNGGCVTFSRAAAANLEVGTVRCLDLQGGRHPVLGARPGPAGATRARCSGQR